MKNIKQNNSNINKNISLNLSFPAAVVFRKIVCETEHIAMVKQYTWQAYNTLCYILDLCTHIKPDIPTLHT